SLDLFGCVTGPLRDDLDHRRRQVGIGVDGQAPKGPDAGSNEQGSKQRDEKTLREGAGDNPVDYRTRPNVWFQRCRRDAIGLVDHWLCANWRNKPPSDTTLSPDCSPDAIW